MTYANPDNVVAELGRPAASDAETDQWWAWIGRVERTIGRRFRRAGLDLDTQVGLGEPTAADVIDVVVSAVIRKIRGEQREGRTSVTRAVDDASITDRWEGEVEGLGITDTEWDDLLPRSDAKAFSTRPGFQSDSCEYETPWRRPPA